MCGRDLGRHAARCGRVEHRIFRVERDPAVGLSGQLHFAPERLVPVLLVLLSVSSPY
jgi:hypothetical protein